MGTRTEALREQIVGLLPRRRRFARAGQLRPDAQLAPWLFGILRHAWIDEARARNRRDRVFAAAELGESVGDSSSGTEADIVAVQEAMSRLPEEQRTAVALVLVEGLSYKEAAEVMGVPIGTLTSRLARGREALQATLMETAGAVR